MSLFTAEVQKLYASLREMAANLQYIRRESAHLEMPAALRTEISRGCEEFESALYDVRKEVRTLEDKLGMHPGEEPFDPDVVNPDPRANLGFILRWLQTELDALHEIVTRLDSTVKDDPSLGIVCVLVTESAANVHRSYTVISDAVRAIDAALDLPGDG